MGKKVNRGIKWQAPSNGRIFDLPFGEKDDGKYMTNRTLGTLMFIKEKSPTEHEIKQELKQYIHNKFPNHPINNSCVMHFIKNPLYYGMIDEYQTDTGKRYMLTIDGINFLNYYNLKKYDKMLESFIIGLMRVKFTNNKATKKTVTPNVYPFRIIYFLIKKYKKLSTNDFKSWIPFIRNKSDLDREKFKFIIGEKKYDKIHIWVMKSLVSLGIFLYKNDNYEINEKCYYRDIDEFISDPDFLFDDAVENRNKKNKDFTNILKNKVKERDGWKCWINKSHPLVMQENNKPILEVHHIIPWEMKESFKELDINSMENLIAICNPCHQTIHHGKLANVKEYCDIIWNRKKEFLSKYLNKVDDLILIYKRLY